MVRKLTKEELLYLSNNIKFTHHSIDRLNIRLDLDMDYYQDRTIISGLIKNSDLSYINTDGSINVGINKYEYFVLLPKYKYGMLYYLMITFKEKSCNGFTLEEKYELAKKGVSR